MPAAVAIRSLLSKTAFVAASCMLAGAAGANELPSLVVPDALQIAGQDASADARVLPVWNNESGRLEALLLLDSPGIGGKPLDRLLGHGAPAPGFGARLQLGDGSRISSALQFDPDAGMALLCNGSIGLASSLGTLGQNCLLASLGDNDMLFRASSPGVGFTSGWRSADGGVDLSFGLSWLDTSFDDSLAGFANPASIAWADSPALAATLWPSASGSLAGARLDARQMQLGATLNFSSQRWMSLAGTLGTQQFTPAGTGLPLHWETATVTLGVGYRGITGQLTGRLLELPTHDATWSGLDLGVSWRTPWRAELTVGARNVVGSGPDARAKWPLAELPALEDPSARVPYVRYRQDL